MSLNKQTWASYLLVWILSLTGSTVSFGQSKQRIRNTAPAPSFTVTVKPVVLNTKLPFLQSCAWARAGDKVLLMGGRIEGFHGLSNADTLFNRRKANTSVWVLNLADFSARELKLDQHDPAMLQFFSSNMEFFQDNDTLYLAGGFGIRNPGDVKSNHTFDRMVAIQVSKMIEQVETGGTIQKAILSTATSPFVQVTGGELKKAGGTFYLAFGQKYDTAYTESTTGIYTRALRKFRVEKGVITDTSSLISPMLNRRDLTVAPIIRPGGNLYVAFGGVFTPSGDGYANPVYIDLNGPAIKMDTLKQVTSQYDCAYASLYDSASGTNITLLMGGIGMSQYHPTTKTWEHGDKGELLPFVKSITQMKFQNGTLSQHIQLPPLEAELPALIGANAVFFPHANLYYSTGVIDYSKLKGSSVSIGYLYGGILSSFPSSDLTPTTINKTLYQVFLHKKAGTQK